MNKDLRRLLAKVNTIDPNRCWQWLGYCGRGYGYFWYQGKGAKAHRVAYILLKGPLSDALELDHTCNNKSCINPAHLEAVTKIENMRRYYTEEDGNARNRVAAFIGSQKAASIRKARTHCKRGHKFTLENTYLCKSGARHCRACTRLWELNNRIKPQPLPHG